MGYIPQKIMKFKLRRRLWKAAS